MLPILVVRSAISSSLRPFASSSDIRPSGAAPPPAPAAPSDHDSCCGGTLRVEQMR